MMGTTEEVARKGATEIVVKTVNGQEDGCNMTAQVLRGKGLNSIWMLTIVSWRKIV